MLSLDPAVIDQSSPIPAERRLWAAVQRQAVCDFLGIDRHCESARWPMLRNSAEAWFFSDRYTMGSFRWVCDELELDAGWLRRRLLEMADKNAHVSTRQVKAVDPGPAEVGADRA
jgi:hypothetical protein